MSEMPQNLTGLSYRSMTFGNKITAAADLTKQHGLTIFLTMLAGWFVLFAILIVGLMIFGGAMAVGGNQGFSGFQIGAILGIFLFYIIFFFLAQFFMVGVDSLLLKFVDHREVDGGVVNQVLSPWRNFVPVLLCIVVWFVLYFLANIILAIFNLIPFLGILINLAGSIVLAMVMSCVQFYIADSADLSVRDVVVTPVNVVANNFLTWLAAMGTAIAVYLPGILALFVIMYIVSGSTALMILAGLAGLVYFVAASIYIFVFFAITYRQTHGGGMETVVDRVF